MGSVQLLTFGSLNNLLDNLDWKSVNIKGWNAAPAKNLWYKSGIRTCIKWTSCNMALVIETLAETVGSVRENAYPSHTHTGMESGIKPKMCWKVLEKFGNWSGMQSVIVIKLFISYHLSTLSPTVCVKYLTTF